MLFAPPKSPYHQKRQQGIEENIYDSTEGIPDRKTRQVVTVYAPGQHVNNHHARQEKIIRCTGQNDGINRSNARDSHSDDDCFSGRWQNSSHLLSVFPLSSVVIQS